VLNAEELSDSLLIKANNRFAVDNCDWGALKAHVDQLFQRCAISAHILIDKLHAILRKKLFLLVARTSTGLRVDDYSLGHDQGTSDWSICGSTEPSTIKARIPEACQEKTLYARSSRVNRCAARREPAFKTGRRFDTV
jgi:hypothetical protein